MATKVYSEFAHTQTEQTGQKTIYCDSIDDIATLPTDGKKAAVGSTAIVVENPIKVYMLSPSNEWKQVQ